MLNSYGALEKKWQPKPVKKPNHKKKARCALAQGMSRWNRGAALALMALGPRYSPPVVVTLVALGPCLAAQKGLALVALGAPAYTSWGCGASGTEQSCGAGPLGVASTSSDCGWQIFEHAAWELLFHLKWAFCHFNSTQSFM